jgi:hypothetical protein
MEAMALVPRVPLPMNAMNSATGMASVGESHGRRAIDALSKAAS